MTHRRLIEETFPLQQVSEHSAHEKFVRHGHISTLHIWPARRPLAVSRAAITAALLPDPENEEERKELNKKLASITKWKTENGPALKYFRKEIRKAFGGRAPRVMDMFAGGGAIPLEAMRLGCDVTAIDYNPVAWFILKCTLEFPQQLAGEKWPLPPRSLITESEDANAPQEESVLSKENNGSKQLRLLQEGVQTPAKQGALADHIQYWAEWVLAKAKEDLNRFYPSVDGKEPVAYLWARTVPCPDPSCGTTVPLLKTLWLSRKKTKSLEDTPENRARADFLRVKRTKNRTNAIINGRRALRLLPTDSGQVRFEVWTPEPKEKVPSGTMARGSAKCPACGINISKSYIKQCGTKKVLSSQMTAVMVDESYGKDYRAPTDQDDRAVQDATHMLDDAAAEIPYGLPTESLPSSGTSGASRAFTIPLYGFETWADLFTPRQLLALTTFVRHIRSVPGVMRDLGYSETWIEAIHAYLAVSLDRLVDRSSTLCRPDPTPTQSGVINTFSRFALPITWDFIEGVPLSESSGGFISGSEWVVRFAQHAQYFSDSQRPNVRRQSSTESLPSGFDAIVTDPPYYDAIPYAELSDFFYVWLRRTIGDRYPDVFDSPLTPKIDELVQQSGTTGHKGKEAYEAGMATAFARAWEALKPDGRFVIAFAHKEPEAWETLVKAIISAGFTVTASWPVDTEMTIRTRAVGSAALASSIWLVCRKRSGDVGTGRYRSVRRLMEERITGRLRYFWDIGLSGPDFVWAAVGPALESYSSYEQVKRLDGSLFTVSDFLNDVRRMVADFALGQILKGQSTEGLDEWTRYYLMHRNNFGLDAAPVGECILLSQGYGIDLDELRSNRGFIENAPGSNVRLAKWDERDREDLGQPHPTGGLPLIDVLHKLMHLWNNGDLDEVSTYAAEKGLRQHDLFWAIAQAILEVAPANSRERTLLENIVAWGRGRPGTVEQPVDTELPFAKS